MNFGLKQETFSYPPPVPARVRDWQGRREKVYRLSVMDIDPVRRIFYLYYLPKGTGGASEQIGAREWMYYTDSDDEVWQWAQTMADWHADQIAPTK